jgi:hypothetical protein
MTTFIIVEWPLYCTDFTLVQAAERIDVLTFFFHLALSITITAPLLRRTELRMGNARIYLDSRTHEGSTGYTATEGLRICY